MKALYSKKFYIFLNLLLIDYSGAYDCTHLPTRTKATDIDGGGTGAHAREKAHNGYNSIKTCVTVPSNLQAYQDFNLAAGLNGFQLSPHLYTGFNFSDGSNVETGLEFMSGINETSGSREIAPGMKPYLAIPSKWIKEGYECEHYINGSATGNDASRYTFFDIRLNSGDKFCFQSTIDTKNGELKMKIMEGTLVSGQPVPSIEQSIRCKQGRLTNSRLIDLSPKRVTAIATRKNGIVEHSFSGIKELENMTMDGSWESTEISNGNQWKDFEKNIDYRSNTYCSGTTYWPPQSVTKNGNFLTIGGAKRGALVEHTKSDNQDKVSTKNKLVSNQSKNHKTNIDHKKIENHGPKISNVLKLSQTSESEDKKSTKEKTDNNESSFELKNIESKLVVNPIKLTDDSGNEYYLKSGDEIAIVGINDKNELAYKVKLISSRDDNLKQFIGKDFFISKNDLELGVSEVKQHFENVAKLSNYANQQVSAPTILCESIPHEAMKEPGDLDQKFETKLAGYTIYPLKSFTVIKSEEGLSERDLKSNQCDALVNGPFYYKNKALGPLFDGKDWQNNDAKAFSRGFVSMMDNGQVNFGSLQRKGKSNNCEQASKADLEQNIADIEGQTKSKIQSFIGGGALLLRNGKKVSAEEVIKQQCFLQGIGKLDQAQMRKVRHTVLAYKQGKTYALVTPEKTAAQLQDDLQKAGFDHVVMYDGGGACFAINKSGEGPCKQKHHAGFCIKSP